MPFISKADYDLLELVFPFITYLPEEDERFILIHDIDQDTVRFSGEMNSKGFMDEKEFLSRWELAIVTRLEAQRIAIIFTIILVRII